jgi:hypothetical protein
MAVAIPAAGMPTPRPIFRPIGSFEPEDSEGAEDEGGQEVASDTWSEGVVDVDDESEEVESESIVAVDDNSDLEDVRVLLVLPVVPDVGLEVVVVSLLVDELSALTDGIRVYLDAPAAVGG